MRIHLYAFKGMAPRVDPRDLPDSYGQTATNVKSQREGVLSPLYGLAASVTLTGETSLKTIFPVKTTGATFWFCSKQEAFCVTAPVYDADSRFYYADGVRPKASNYALASDDGDASFGSPNTEYYVGPTKPSAALTATVRGTGDGIVEESCAYVYTFVDTWGGEGEPSDPTDVTDVEGGQYVELGNFEIPVPTGYGIVGIRVYRTSIGVTNETDYLYVSEINEADLDYIQPASITTNGDIWDDKDTDDDEITDACDLGEAIQTESYEEPPSALSGLMLMSNGVFVGYRGNEVYLSEPFIPYGYPSDNSFSADFDVKAIGGFDTTCVIGTKGNPYVLNCYDPQNASFTRLSFKQSCLFTRAMVSGKNFVAYPAPAGLAMVTAEGPEIATRGIFTEDQWKALLTTSTDYDKTIIAFLYDGKYCAFFEGTANGFVIDFLGDMKSYSTFSLPSENLVYGGYLDEATDTLYLLIKISTTYYIKKWEGDMTSYLKSTWKSKKFFTANTALSCAQVNADVQDDQTGTGTVTTSGTAVEGTGTSFATELEAGDALYLASLKEYREIESITDADSLVLVNAFSSDVTGEAFKYNTICMNLYHNGTLHFTKGISAIKPFRIKAGRAREREIEIRSSRDVYEIKMAQSFEELLVKEEE